MIRSAGVLLHVTSLPSPYGIGTLGKEAYEFVDFLKEAGQTYWQMLPLGPTGFGNSPYQSLSSYAGNPYLIDLDQLIEEGLLEKKDVEGIEWMKDEGHVDFGKQYDHRYALLKKACQKLETLHPEDYFSFLESEKNWVRDYAIFMAIKEERNGEPWTKWPEELRDHHSSKVQEESYRLRETVIFYERVQYLFFKQMKALKKYANEAGIQIIGDLPFYIAQDSSDVWVDPEQFEVNENFQMKYVSGFPCDGANPNGQKWGNPLFNWERMKQDGYTWWCERAKHVLKSCDVLRVDHFQGYHSFFAVPFDGEAKDGHWVQGPGLEPFQRLQEMIGKKEIIIEDLGYLSDAFKNMIKESGFPGMRILQYAFDPNDPGSIYMPFQHVKNCVVYTGTHDNNTIEGWKNDPNEKSRIERACCYLSIKKDKDFTWNIVKCAYGSVADLVIIPLQDLLGSDALTRMNNPSGMENAWSYRCKKGDYDHALAKKIKELMLLYCRNNWNAE